MMVVNDLSGKTAVVTGGAKGIGRAVAERFRVSGAHVWVWDLVPITRDGIDSIVVDVTRSDRIAGAVSRTIDQAPGIDILVNNPGYLGAYAAFEQQHKRRRLAKRGLYPTQVSTRRLM